MLGGRVLLWPVEVGVAVPARGWLVAAVAAGIGERMVGSMWMITKGWWSQNSGQGAYASSSAVTECGYK